MPDDPRRSGGGAFTGFPVAALDFYDDLEVDNTRSFWEAHRSVYEEAVRTPMSALAREVEPEFGPAKVYRPYRDVRFAKDKTPYKTHQGMFCAAGPVTGFYLQIGAAGVTVGSGYYDVSGPQLAAIRAAIADERSGPRLERLLRRLRREGWEVGGERLKTAPRGYDAEHQRIELLRHKRLVVSRSYGFDPVIHSPGLSARVRSDWRTLRPLVTWLDSATAAAG